MVGKESPVESKTELIEIWLIVSAAPMVGSKQKGLEVYDCGMEALEITGLVFRCIDCDIF